MRSSQKVATVSVGIPAYNEERNIAPLLRAILAQRCEGFELLEVVVLSDGSTDRTVEEVRSVADPRVRLIHEPYRIGQSARQSQLLRLCTGDVSVLLEADTLPEDDGYLQSMVDAVLGGADLVHGVPIAKRSEHWVSRVLNRQRDIFFRYWPKSRTVVVSGRGGRALSRNLRDRFSWPAHVPEDLYLYGWAISHGFKLGVAPGARCQFQPPRTVLDYCRECRKAALAIGWYGLWRASLPALPDLAVTPPLKVRLLMALHFVLLSPIDAVNFVFLRAAAWFYRLVQGRAFHVFTPRAQSTKELVV